jgi:hypothetical protein
VGLVIGPLALQRAFELELSVREAEVPKQLRLVRDRMVAALNRAREGLVRLEQWHELVLILPRDVCRPHAPEELVRLWRRHGEPLPQLMLLFMLERDLVGYG